MTSHLTFVHALSPLHAGTGQGIDIIDLPIARERATNLPFLPGSSLKGVLRDASRPNDDLTKRIFGPETTNADAHAGAVVFTDQRLLLLPVRSLLGTFAWATTPYVLQRLARDVKHANQDEAPEVPQTTATEQAFITSTSTIANNNQIYLEDLDLKAKQEKADQWAEWLAVRLFPSDTEWQQELAKRFCIVHNDVFSFLAKHGTEVNARVKIKAGTQTVEKGGLWYEECLPTESILSGMLLVQPNTKTELNTEKIMAHITQLAQIPLQLGGKSTVGRGICRVTISGGA